MKENQKPSFGNIAITVENMQYTAVIRGTPKPAAVWILPDIRDSNGSKISLACMLINNGFSKNQKIYLEVVGSVVSVLLFLKRATFYAL